MKCPLPENRFTPDRKLIGDLIKNADVVVTGAGGSIGRSISGICTHYRPKSLLMLDRSEDSLFRAQQEIPKNSAVRQIICDATDSNMVDSIMSATTNPVVFHAAAYKQVPMLENNVHQAVRNNFDSTRTVAMAARRHNARAFVLASTDKAVRPLSVMGATKMLAESYVREAGYCSVRFGNVINTSGSVLDVWHRQAKKGDDIEITDPAMSRYFITMEDAVNLMLQAASISVGGETFVLDMGEPIIMGHLADWFANEHGVGKRIIGIRPGESYTERLCNENELLDLTSVPGLLVVRPVTTTMSVTYGPGCDTFSFYGSKHIKDSA